MGRPTKYSQQLADRICKAVATSPYGLHRICSENEGFPQPSTVNEWRFDYPDFSVKYARSKILQADILAEYCLKISDESTYDEVENKMGESVFNHEYVARSRLKIDTRKWLASKLLPKQYGDRLVLEQKEEENDKLRQEVLKLRAELDAQNKKDY